MTNNSPAGAKPPLQHRSRDNGVAGACPREGAAIMLRFEDSYLVPMLTYTANGSGAWLNSLTFSKPPETSMSRHIG